MSEDHREGLATEVADVSRLTLTQVRTLDHPVLAGFLERVLRDAGRGRDVVAGFNSSL